MTQELKKKLEQEAYEYFDKNIREIPKDENGNLIINSETARNNDVDAFRHAYVSGGFTMEYGETAAEILGMANEIKNDYDVYKAHSDKDNYDQIKEHFEKEKNMDLWNNNIGQQGGKVSETREELGSFLKNSLDNGHLITTIDNDLDSRQYDQQVNNDYSNLGYIASANAGEFDPNQIDNSLLNLDIRTDLETDFERDIGFVAGENDWELFMPDDIANADGFTNVETARIASNDISPLFRQLVDTSTSDDLENSFYNFDNYYGSSFFYDAGADLLRNTGLYNGRESIINVDPVVLDLDGDGVKLIDYNDSNAVFDVDNDNYAENTGWVSAEDAILVHDVNNDGSINDITETISEFYGAEKGAGQNENFNDGLDALKTFDSNDDGKFDSNDEKFNELKVWQDKDGDGITDEGELQTLSEAGVKSIDLNKQESDRERLEGNVVLSRSTYETNDGETREVAAVDFSTNPIGYEWNEVANGFEIKSEDGQASTFVVQGEKQVVTEKQDYSYERNINTEGLTQKSITYNDYDQNIDQTGEQNIEGSEQADVIYSGKDKNINAYEGNDLIVTKVENNIISTGKGRDKIYLAKSEFVSGEVKSMTVTDFDFRRDKLNIGDITGNRENVTISQNGDDTLISIVDENSNIYEITLTGVLAKKVKDKNIHTTYEENIVNPTEILLKGTKEEDLLTGSNQNDKIVGRIGDDIIDAKEGDDLLYSGKGNDSAFGGKGSDTLQGGAGNDMLVIDSRDKQENIDGGEGLDIVKIADDKGVYFNLENLILKLLMVELVMIF